MNRRLAAIFAAWLASDASLVASPAVAEAIAMIGTGHVGSALGRRLGELGHRIVYGSRHPEDPDVQQLVAGTNGGATAAPPRDAVRGADIVVLALPWEAVEGVVRDLGDLSGVIVVDPTNPRVTAPDGLRDYALDESIAERIQAMAPGALVVKAFNTLGADTMLEPESAGGPVTVPLVGDDARSKAMVAHLIESIGLVPLDLGPLRYARILEGLHLLRYNAGQIGDARFNYHLRPESDE
jgi:predicted dinucleotide-binding enzyme